MAVSLRWLVHAMLLTSSAAMLTLVPLKERYPDAVCMDGTSSGYYWKPATTDEGNSTWIVYLQSGGWCWDNASCTERCEENPERCSSSYWESEANETGLLSDNISSYHVALRTANKVYVGYCTSDAHMGNAEAFGHQFRGSRVVQAVLSDLVLLRGLGSGSGPKKQLLLFGGGSAGARGAMVHLDYVPSMLGSASKNVDLVGYLDSPLWLDLPPLNRSFFEGFANLTHQIYDFANVTHLDEDCSATFIEDRWKCMLGEYRMRFVKTRYFLLASKHDGFQLYFDTGHNETTWTEDQLDYAAQFANKTAELVRTLASKGHAVYAPSCLSHAFSLVDNYFFNHSTEDGTTACDAVQEFLGLVVSNGSDANANRTFQWVDECYDLDCGTGCHIGDPPEDVDSEGRILLSGARGRFTNGGVAMGLLVMIGLLGLAAA